MNEPKDQDGSLDLSENEKLSPDEMTVDVSGVDLPKNEKLSPYEMAPGMGVAEERSSPWDRSCSMPSAVDPVKLKEWLSEASLDQCDWAVSYLAKRVGLFDFYPSPEGARKRVASFSRAKQVEFLQWLFLHSTNTFNGDDFSQLSFSHTRLFGDRTFKAMRNAWNQRLNREKKSAQEALALYLTDATKKKLEKLASQEDLTTDEYVRILVDVVYENPSVHASGREAREAKKREAIAAKLPVSRNTSI